MRTDGSTRIRGAGATFPLSRNNRPRLRRLRRALHGAARCSVHMGCFGRAQLCRRSPGAVCSPGDPFPAAADHVGFAKSPSIPSRCELQSCATGLVMLTLALTALDRRTSGTASASISCQCDSSTSPALRCSILYSARLITCVSSIMCITSTRTTRIRTLTRTTLLRRWGRTRSRTGIAASTSARRSGTVPRRSASGTLDCSSRVSCKDCFADVDTSLPNGAFSARASVSRQDPLRPKR